MKIRILEVDDSDEAVGLAVGDVFHAKKEIIGCWVYLAVDAPNQKNYVLFSSQVEVLNEE